MWSAGFLPCTKHWAEGHNGRVVLHAARYVPYLNGRCELAVSPLLLPVPVPQSNQPQHWGMQPMEAWWKSCSLLWPTYCTAAVRQFKASYAEAEHNASIPVTENSVTWGFSNTFASLIMHYIPCYPDSTKHDGKRKPLLVGNAYDYICYCKQSFDSTATLEHDTKTRCSQTNALSHHSTQVSDQTIP